GRELQVNTSTTYSQSGPAVGVGGAGNFVVAWQSYGSAGTDTDSFSIQGQRYDAAGAPLGTEFQVNTYSTSLQLNPAVAIDGTGNFVVVWESFGSVGSDNTNNIQGQRYNSAGGAQGGPVQGEQHTTTRSRLPPAAG